MIRTYAVDVILIATYSSPDSSEHPSSFDVEIKGYGDDNLNPLHMWMNAVNAVYRFSGYNAEHLWGEGTLSYVFPKLSDLHISFPEIRLENPITTFQETRVPQLD